jgi:surfeit locus 1 family protein
VASDPEPTVSAPEAPFRMSRGRFWFALAACLVGIAILMALGTWQVERLQWKEALVAQIDERIASEPADLDALEAQYAATGDVDYTPATVEGRFLNEGERYFLSTFEGQSGWNVHVPLLVDGERLLFVNRGFVPYDRRDAATRREGQVEGRVTVSGLARNPPAEASGFFVPENDPVGNTFFRRDIDAMVQGLELPPGVRVLPFFLDAGPGRAPGGWPVGGTTVIEIPNNHLQYAITWYGIGLVLVVMTVLLVVSQWRARKP